jgi:hypothetical protein
MPANAGSSSGKWAQGVDHHVAVRVRLEPLVVRHCHAAEHQRPAGREAVGVEAVAYAHRAASPRARCQVARSNLEVVGVPLHHAHHVARALHRHRLVGHLGMRGKRGAQQAEAEHLRGLGVPQVVARYGLADVTAGDALEGIAHRDREQATHRIVGKFREQSIEIATAQARSSRVVHQHPVGVIGPSGQRGQAASHRVGTLVAAIGHRDHGAHVRVDAAPVRVRGSQHHDDATDRWMADETAQRVLEHRDPVQLEVLLGPFTAHARATSPRTTMPSSLRARSSIAASPWRRSVTSASSAALRSRSSAFSCCCTAISSRSWRTSSRPPSPNQSLNCSTSSNTSSTAISARMAVSATHGSVARQPASCGKAARPA